jgi:hypothetical protein
LSKAGTTIHTGGGVVLVNVTAGDVVSVHAFAPQQLSLGVSNEGNAYLQAVPAPGGYGSFSLACRECGVASSWNEVSGWVTEWNTFGSTTTTTGWTVPYDGYYLLTAGGYMQNTWPATDARYAVAFYVRCVCGVSGAFTFAYTTRWMACTGP